MKSAFLHCKGLLCLYNKQNNTYTRHLTRSLRSLANYRGKRSRRNSISTRTHLLFSMLGIWLLWLSNAISESIWQMLTTPVLKYYHWRPSHKLTTELDIKDHIIDMWHMTLMWMVHAVIINEIWHSGVLLLIFNKKRTFIGQNKSTILTLEPVFRIFRAIRSFFRLSVKAHHKCQLSVRFSAICQLSITILAICQ